MKAKTPEARNAASTPARAEASRRQSPRQTRNAVTRTTGMEARSHNGMEASSHTETDADLGLDARRVEHVAHGVVRPVLVRDLARCMGKQENVCARRTVSAAKAANEHKKLVLANWLSAITQTAQKLTSAPSASRTPRELTCHGSHNPQLL